MSYKIRVFIVFLIYVIMLYGTCIYYDYQCYTTEEELISAQNNITAVQNEVETAQNELNHKNSLLQEVETELTQTQGALYDTTQKATELNDKLNSVIDELENANITIADLKSEEYELVYLGDFKITHYCVEKHKHICGNGDGLTATGTYVTPGRTIAVDPKVIPYGTEVYIEGYGWRIAEDCGGSVDNNHIDIAVDTHAQAMDMGVKYEGVWILVKKTS